MRHEDKFWAFYTGIVGFDPLHQVQCLAWSDDLISWSKREEGPVVSDQPEGYGPCFRDPQVFRVGGEWRMIVGSQTPRGGAVLQYRSPDLMAWTKMESLWEAEGDEVGFDCECPDFFPLGDRWVLITSRRGVHWQTGQFDGVTFVSEHRGLCDKAINGDDIPPFYAAKTGVDDSGRRLLFGWVSSAVHPEGRGMIGTPRELSLDEAGRLVQSVPPEFLDRFVAADGGLEAVDGPLRERVAEGRWRTLT
jgi:beta-fructofuranosidase